MASDATEPSIEAETTPPAAVTMTTPSKSMDDDRDDSEQADICRVCRSESDHRALYYPCLCTGSIKYVHQECLMQWLKYSKKEVCELCHHRYSFEPIYRADMPARLPWVELARGLAANVSRLVRMWALYTLVLVSWLGLVPLTACRVYRAVFSASVTNILSLPVQLFSLENVLLDCARGCFLVCIFLCTFICLVWLREQIIHGGPQHWLNLDVPPAGQAGEQQGGDGVEPEEPDDDDEDGNDENDEGLPGDEQEEAGFAPVGDEHQGEPVQGGEAEEVPGNGDGEDDQPAAEGGQAGNGGGNGNQWGDWGDRMGDDLTWQRLLGLDGSLVFLEHVFWVISLNTLFTIVFAFSPYQIGSNVLKLMGLASKLVYFPTVLSTLFGYVLITVTLLVLHQFARLFRIKMMHRVLGMSYLVLKVFLLVLIEIGFFRIVCGWWLDICSLPLFASSLSQRLDSFSASPAGSVFLHWLVGMVYVFYFASFVLILREVLRPGVLWFLRNLNDPDFNPIQEMIELPVLRHLRRLLASTTLFAVTILLIVYLPLRIIQKCYSTLLPYNISLTADTPLSELSLELLILQVILPALLEQTQARQMMKTALRAWCWRVGQLLGLTDYLLSIEDQQQFGGGVQAGEHAENPPVPPVAAQAAAGALQGLAAQHQALLLAREPAPENQPYHQPSWFPMRILGLLGLMSMTITAGSIVGFVFPVWLGRQLVGQLSGLHNVHELYTISVGLYACWCLMKLGILASEWLPRGWNHMADGVKMTLTVAMKILIASMPVLVVIPLLIGTCFQLLVVCPLRVGRHQSALLFPWQDWAMGVLHCKIFCAAVMMGPDWWMKTVFEQLYGDGLLNLRLGFLYRRLVFPVVLTLALVLAVPYTLANSVVSALGGTYEERIIFVRYAYPFLLTCFSSVLFVAWQCTKLRALAQRIRNDKYLVGTKLVNYDRDKAKSPSVTVDN